MRIKTPVTCAAAVMALVTALPESAADAGSRGATAKHYHGGYFGRSANYRGGRSTRVYGFRQGVGGYSYSKDDTVNTSGLSRSNFGSTNTYRDPMTDTQSLAGPFDHGWFFDSGITANGGNSPYRN